MISKLFLATLLSIFFIGDSKWTDPATLMRFSKFIVTDACVDSEDNTLVLFQDYRSYYLQMLTYIGDGSYIDRFKLVMKNKGVRYDSYPRNRIVCRQDDDNNVMVFSITTSSNGAGILAETKKDEDFVEKYKREGIDTGSILFISSTERTILFMANKTTLWFVTRPSGSEIFSKEQIIYSSSSFRFSDISSVASKRNNDFIWNVATRVKEEIYYFLGTDNGVRWEGPRLLGQVHVMDNTRHQISLIANYDLSSTIFLVYRYYDTPYLVRITWTLDNGVTWAKPAHTQLTNSYFNPYGFLYTIENKTALFIVDANGDYVISKSWTSSELNYTEGQTPLYDAVYALQASQPSQILGLGGNPGGERWISSSNQTEDISL